MSRRADHSTATTPTVTDDHSELRAAVQRRTLTVIVISQILGGAGLAAGVSVGALLATHLLGGDDLAGLPTALFTLGSALAAFLVGRSTQRLGRRIGLTAGFITGGIGAIGVVIAAMIASVPLLFIALFVYGAGSATNLQARYAGTDLATPQRRGTAISIAMVSTTLGAVAGPNLITPLGRLASAIGIPALAGPFLLAAVAYLAAGTILFTALRPDPFLLARSLAESEPEPPTTQRQHGSAITTTPTVSDRGVTRVGRGAYAGAAVMVLTQIAMVAIMTMTPVHMSAHHHDLGQVGMVIGLHIAAMYLPSLVTGMLVDRLGSTPVAAASGLTLLAAGVVAAVAPGDSLVLLIVALVLLGLGWNFGLIAGTTLLVDATVPANRARTQGTVDVLVALAGASGGVLSGLVMAATSFAGLSLAGGLLALALIPVLVWARGRHCQG